MAAGILKDGSATVTTHAVAVPLATTKTLASWLMIQAFTTNVGQCRVAGKQTTIAANHGFEVNKGDTAVGWYIPGGHFDLNLIYVDSDNDGDAVKFIYTAL